MKKIIQSILYLFCIYGCLMAQTINKNYTINSVQDSGCYFPTTHDLITDMGLYGGRFNDITHSTATQRIFAAMESPLSLFYSDDSCKTWQHAFPYDSLEYECETRGWGGSAERVLTNAKGWVAVHAQENNGGHNSSVISFLNGDSGTFHTAMDPFMLQGYGFQANSLITIGLSEYYMFSCLDKYITIIDTSNFNPTSDIIDITSKIAGINDKATVISIAAPNDSINPTFYTLIDTTSNAHNGQPNSVVLLYKYNGSNFNQIALPSALNDPREVFVHPNYGDTIFVAGYSSSNAKTYRSFDGGSNWVDISNTQGILSDVDFSVNWSNTYSQNKGIFLIIDGKAISTDLGNSWVNSNSSILLLRQSVNPTNDNIVIGGSQLGGVVSYSGVTGSFALSENKKLEAIEINKISVTPTKSIVYIATQSGLAYTTAYSDTLVDAYNKWHSPYGEFPVSSIPADPLFSVAIDPSDSLHIIAGGYNACYLTTTGYSGFFNINNGLNNNGDIKDICFINSKIIIAVTSYNATGNIWRSIDGGYTWNIASPLGFCCGNTIAIGTNVNDTVIYVGSGDSYNGALYRSNDLGQTWIFVNNGPNSNSSSLTNLSILDIAVAPGTVDTLYIAAGTNQDGAFVISKDGGLTYQYDNIMSIGKVLSVAVNETKPDSSIYISVGECVFEYNPIVDTSFLRLRGYPGEKVYDLHF